MPKAGALQSAFGSWISPQPAKGSLLLEAWSQHQVLWRTVWAASSGTSTAVVWVDGISFCETVALAQKLKRGKYQLLNIFPDISGKTDLLPGRRCL